ncbi:MAG TPA: hypothetical protein VM573_05160, partial [Actinomycetota bacterium]|nr:hypothetical protein [Actinomycetota bacterium]
MSGAGGVVALVFLQWTVGWLGAAAWSQSWSVVRRGHFRITAWCIAATAAIAVAANRAALGEAAGLQPLLVVLVASAALLYLAFQYSRTDVPGAVAGAAGTAVGAAALFATARLIPGWPGVFAALHLLAGAALLGGVTNGMLLGHWYLNQPGLKPWA